MRWSDCADAQAGLRFVVRKPPKIDFLASRAHMIFHVGTFREM